MNDDEKYELVFNYIKITFCIMFVGAAAYFLLRNGGVIPYPAEKEKIKKGEFYSTKCKLVEKNIYNGFFTEDVNKIKCDDPLGYVVFDFVKVSEYESAIASYQKSIKWL